MDKPSTVPDTPAEISAAWLNAMLENQDWGPGSEKIEVARIGEEFGLAAELYRITWPRGSVVIKMWSTADTAGENEIAFYETFGEQLGARIPRCWGSAVDRQRMQAVLLLEDIPDPLQGDCLRPLSFSLAAAVAGELAGMQARWLNQAELLATDWLPRFDDQQFPGEWLRSRRAEFLGRFDHLLSPLARRLLLIAEAVVGPAHERLRQAPLTLVHRDFHLDNIIFERGERPVFLDWTSCQAGPAVLNMADLLFAMVPLRYFDSLVEVYLNHMARLGRPVDRASLMTELDDAVVMGFLRATCGTARWRPTGDRGRQLQRFGIARAIEMVEYWEKRRKRFV